jgi:putative chitinase
MMLTKSVLENLCPRPRKSGEKQAIWDGYVNALVSPEGQSLLVTYGVTSDIRLAHLLAQWMHECGGFTLIWESGAYQTRQIIAIFGVGHHSARITDSEARALRGNGPALFERAYGLGNPKKARELGNTQPGDGWRFRGCGIVQITGRAAHERYARAIGCAVEELAKPLYAIHAALLEWKEKGCNAIADRDDGTDTAIYAITKKINGGLNGYPARRANLKKAKSLLRGAAPEPKSTSVDRPPIAEIGDDGATVRELQELLVRAGYPLAVDGKMGPRTEAILAGFQVNHGLRGSGRADDATWKTLREVTDPEKNKPRPAPPVDMKQAKKESRLLRGATRVRLLIRSIYYTLFGGAVLEQSGAVDVAETLSSQADRVQSIWGKFSGLMSGHGWLLLACCVLIIGLWMADRFFGKGVEEYVEKTA